MTDALTDDQVTAAYDRLREILEEIRLFEQAHARLEHELDEIGGLLKIQDRIGRLDEQRILLERQMAAIGARLNHHEDLPPGLAHASGHAWRAPLVMVGKDNPRTVESTVLGQEAAAGNEA